MLPKAAMTLLPLGRRWPVGPDEGAFVTAKTVAPHQLGRMTYGRATSVSEAVSAADAAVSHGLASSPRWGEADGGRLQRLDACG